MQDLKIIRVLDRMPEGLLPINALAQIDAIFFEASGRTFTAPAERAAFHERWLGRYITHDPQHLWLALAQDCTIVGYLAGCLDDPAKTPRFADILYFAGLAEHTARYPAHLHINLAPAARSQGLGPRLIDAFAADVRAASLPGLHVVTSANARNVGFYTRAGFHEQTSLERNGNRIVMLARTA